MSNLDRCHHCNEQYCDAIDGHGEPVHYGCDQNAMPLRASERAVTVERACHVNLPAGTVLMHRGGRLVRLLDHMRGTFAHVAVIRKDGERDQRWRAWSGSLPFDTWHTAADPAAKSAGEVKP